MNKKCILLFCILTEIGLIASIYLATLFHGFLFAIFYNLLYGIIISVTIPLIILNKNKEGFETVGLKKLGIKQYIVLFAFVAFSIGGQLIPKMAASESIPWNLLPVCIIPLIMTTFFEEFLFRGFIQTRIESAFNPIVAIIMSGLAFSLYHLGYPGFRTIPDLLLLFAVGLGFAISYKLSGNNLIVSYFVNLPNAFVTYMLKSKQFPVFHMSSTVYAAITIIILLLCFAYFVKKHQRYIK